MGKSLQAAQFFGVMTPSFGFLPTLFRVKVLFSFMIVAVLLIFVELFWSSNSRVRFSSIYHVPGFDASASDRIRQQDWPCVDRMASQYNRVEDIFCFIFPKFIPTYKNPCFHDYGLNTTRLRCLPYFYIIGMDKSGSTDLHSRIAEHPMMMGNRGTLGKETAYWSWLRYGIYNKRTDLPKMFMENYIDMFSDTADLLEDTNLTQIITGDATPMDLWDFRSWPTIPQNKYLNEPGVLTPHMIRHIYRGHNPKFIIQFREPIERLYSDYIFLNYGRNPAEFHNHSLEAIEMVNSCVGNYTRRICYFSDELYRALPARLHLGCYSVFLREWFNVFPRDSFLITRTDEYTSDMERTLEKVFTFLDLPLLPGAKMAEILNQTRRHVTQKKEGTILPETVRALRTFYESCNQETAEMLKDDRFLWLDHYT